MIRDTGRIADRFRAFVEEARSHGSPLYEHLSRCVSEDSEALAIAAEVLRPPVPNTFFAAVHFILLKEPHHRLGRYYGSVAEIPESPEDAYPVFREFLLEHRSEIIPILLERMTQTNEVRRCSYLVPAFQWIFEKGGGRDLALIDVGCSAGLHMLWDRYFYDYGSGQIGNPLSPVRIDCEVRGPLAPPVPEAFPPCAYRVGIDLHPIDLQNPEERRWLEALVFPDHADRRSLLSAAIDVAMQSPAHVEPRMIAGDAIAILPEMLGEVPDATSLCVYHCHAMCQLSEADWKAFGEMLVAQSANREIFWLNAEGYEVRVRHLRNGQAGWVNLANKDGHGRWLEWLGN